MIAVGESSLVVFVLQSSIMLGEIIGDKFRVWHKYLLFNDEKRELFNIKSCGSVQNTGIEKWNIYFGGYDTHNKLILFNYLAQNTEMGPTFEQNGCVEV